MNKKIPSPSDGANKYSQDNSQIQNIAKFDFIVDFYTGNDREYFNILEENREIILQSVEIAISTNFSEQVNTMFSGLLEVEIEKMEWGSVLGTVVLILSAGFTSYEFIGKYKDFYESLALLRQHLRALINRAIKKSIKNHFPYEIPYRVNVTYTSVQDINQPLSQKNNKFELQSRSMNLFFWYLLTMNIVLIIIVAILVYHAVSVTYFFTT